MKNDNKSQMIDSIISYADSFIAKLKKQRDMISEVIAKLEKERNNNQLYRQHKSGDKPTEKQDGTK